MNAPSSITIRSIVLFLLIFCLATYIFTGGQLTVGQATTLPAAKSEWRRTSAGWERVDHWPRTNEIARSRQQTSNHHGVARRIDTHPAVLALTQLVGSLLGLAIFRSHRRSPLTVVAISAAITRSFRASAFGS